MILDLLDSKLDGNSWEELCQSCYRIRYQVEHYTEIPATYEGDAGIEGFTQTGIVIQCYCPEKEFSDDELYEHQRNKMTTDINKMLLSRYKERLIKLGVPIIKEWHFVIPYYKDSRIIQHAETKRKEVLEKKKTNPEQYNYIDDNFIIIIKQAEDFRFEITRIIRKSITGTKVNLAIQEAPKTDWKDCDSEKVDNIKRKVAAVMGMSDEDESLEDDFNEVVDTFIQSYIKGLEIMNQLRVSFAEIYEDVYGLEQAYKKEVRIKTRMNTNKSMNSSIFNEILAEFGQKLKETCDYFAEATIVELKNDIVSMWLADCSMQFRR